MILELPPETPAVQPSPQFALAQPWRESQEDDFAPCEVAVTWSGKEIIVRVFCQDAEVMTKATDDNQPLFELGDVFEIFLQREGEPGYVELHVSPHGQRMHLDLPGPRGRPTPEAEPLSFAEMLVTPVGFSSETEITESGWRAEIRIPATLFALEKFQSGDRFAVSFSRYDYFENGRTVLSTSAAHSVLDFYRPEDWTPIILSP